MKLLTAAAAGNGAAMAIRQALNREISHLYTLFVWGTFGGATVTLQISPDEPNTTPSNWFTVAGVSLTQAGAVNVEFRAHHVRAVVTGGSAQAVEAKLL